MKKLFSVSILASAMALSACGGGDSDSSVSTTEVKTTTTPTTTTTTTTPTTTTTTTTPTTTTTTPTTTTPTKTTAGTCEVSGNNVYATATGCTYSSAGLNGGAAITYTCSNGRVQSSIGISAQTVKLNDMTVMCK